MAAESATMAVKGIASIVSWIDWKIFFVRCFLASAAGCAPARPRHECLAGKVALTPRELRRNYVTTANGFRTSSPMAMVPLGPMKPTGPAHMRPVTSMLCQQVGGANQLRKN